MLFDTDIFIWTQRGSIKTARLIEKEDERLLSVQSYMELLQCAQNKKQQQGPVQENVLVKMFAHGDQRKIAKNSYSPYDLWNLGSFFLA